MKPCPACGAVPEEAKPLPNTAAARMELGPAAGKPPVFHDCDGEQALQGALDPDRPR